MAKKQAMEFSAVDEIGYLRDKLADCEVDAEKFDAGNKSAGMRLRKALMEVRNSAQAVRKAIVEARKDK